MPASNWIDAHMDPGALRKIRVNGIELHTVEHGHGETILLVHGGLSDYRSWASQVEAFSLRHRVVSYSRRYSFPNKNPIIEPDYSVFVEAEDLAALIDHLELGRVHLVGHSYGAFAALVLALNRPELIRTLIIAEPPVHRLIKDVDGGEVLFAQLIMDIWNPVKQAFANGDPEEAIRRFTNGLGGQEYYENLPPSARASRLQNARAVQALMQSPHAFPVLTREEIQQLKVPTLILEGEKTVPIHQLVDQELLHCIPNCQRAIISDAAHGTPFDNPSEFNQAVLDFVGRHGYFFTL
jgi:non-heme chloroperoxidase